MSRLGKTPLDIPKNVEVSVEGKNVKIKGPKGQLEVQLPEAITVSVKDNLLLVQIAKKTSNNMNNMHGLYRSLLKNKIEGVVTPFEKRLSLIGVGFRAAVKGSVIDLKLGYSHPTEVRIPEGIIVKVEKNTEIIITGCDKQMVGQLAADVRKCRKPEPYKGKGIRYKTEVVRKKAGKTAKGGAK